MRVLVTRPAADAERTAAALRKAGHEPILAPLFEIRPLAHAMPDCVDALAATSANALRHARFAPMHKALPLYAVGDATAAEADRLGFPLVRSAQGDVGDLAALLRAEFHGDALVYLAGRPRRDDALQALDGRFAVITVETYETVTVEALPEAARRLLGDGEVEAALHFSPRSAAAFEALVDLAGLREAAARALHISISEAARVSFPLAKIAERPNLAAMIAALGPIRAGC